VAAVSERLPGPHLEAKCIVDGPPGCGRIIHLDHRNPVGHRRHQTSSVSGEVGIEDHSGHRPTTEDPFRVDWSEGRERSVAVFDNAVRSPVRA
jgi:hypothetical protein